EPRRQISIHWPPYTNWPRSGGSSHAHLLASRIAASSPCRENQLPKEPRRKRLRFPHPLRVPLDSHHEVTCIVALYGFNHTVWSARRHAKAAPNPVERLMVGAVHPKLIPSVRPLSQMRPRFE